MKRRILIGVLIAIAAAAIWFGEVRPMLFPPEPPPPHYDVVFTLVDACGGDAQTWAAARKALEKDYGVTFEVQSVDAADAFSRMKTEVLAGGKYADLVVLPWREAQLANRGGFVAGFGRAVGPLGGDLLGDPTVYAGETLSPDAPVLVMTNMNEERRTVEWLLDSITRQLFGVPTMPTTVVQ